MMSLAATCLALAIYFEARGEPDLGKHYVAHTVMNRSVDYEEGSVCAAVFDPEQFSWTINVKRSINLSVMTSEAIRQVSDQKSWLTSIEIAKKVQKRKRDITNGAKFFNERRKGIRYKTKLKPRTIGKHTFY